MNGVSEDVRFTRFSYAARVRTWPSATARSCGPDNSAWLFGAFVHDALRVPEARKLHEADRVAEQVARGGLRFEPFAEALADRQIERVARHLVHVRDIAVERVASARADPADADDSFADAVVENAGRRSRSGRSGKTVRR